MTAIVVITIFALSLLPWISGLRFFQLVLTLVPLALIVSQFLLIELLVGAVSVKTVAFVLAVPAFAMVMLHSKKPVYVSANNRGKYELTVAWLVYVYAIAVAFIVNGSFPSYLSFTDFVGRYIFAFFLFVSIAFGLKTRKQISAIVVALVLIFLGNFIFALFQYLGYEFSNEVHEALFPRMRQLEADLIEAGEISSFGYSPGLSNYSITTGYMFSCFGFFLPALMSRFFKLSETAAWFVAAALVLIGGAIILSRSTILTAAVGLMIYIFLSSKGRRIAAQFLLLLPAAIVMLVTFLPWGDLSDQFGMTRLLEFGDEGRLRILDSSFEYIAQNFLFGGYLAAQGEGLLSIGAHNFVVNAFAYYGLWGVLGLLPLLVVIAAQLRRFRLSFARKQKSDLDHFACGAFVSVILYFLKSVFHNESIVTSGIILGVLMGIFFASISIPSTNENAKSLRRRRSRGLPVRLDRRF